MVSKYLAEYWNRWSRKGLLMVALCGLLATTTPTQANANDPPVILEFAFEWLGGDFWVIYGFVEDEDPDTCRVDFFGCLMGYSCDVSSTGEYSLLLEVSEGTAGIVPAIAIDAEELTSDPAYDDLGNY